MILGIRRRAERSESAVILQLLPSQKRQWEVLEPTRWESRFLLSNVLHGVAGMRWDS